LSSYGRVAQASACVVLVLSPLERRATSVHFHFCETKNLTG
jgi:hypothetical protein